MTAVKGYAIDATCRLMRKGYTTGANARYARHMAMGYGLHQRQVKYGNQRMDTRPVLTTGAADGEKEYAVGITCKASEKRIHRRRHMRDRWKKATPPA